MKIKPAWCCSCGSSEHLVLANGGFTSITEYWYCRHCKVELDSAGYPPGYAYEPSEEEQEWIEDYLGQFSSVAGMGID